jgi:hypothetical protein
MNVLLIRSDLPESPEVLLLAGLLADSNDPLGWIPTPEVIVCKLIKIWAWVAEHGHRDSDSLDYRIPTGIVAALEKQFACSGLLAAMCAPHIDWCRQDSDSLAFCRFAEWNGDDAMRKRGDSVRARNSRSRSRSRQGIRSAAKVSGSGEQRAASAGIVTGVTAGARTDERKIAPETVPKLVTKAHAKCDARHELRAPSIDVDVDVLRDNCFKKTSTSTSSSGETQPENAITAEEAFALIRRALASAVDADDDQVAKDRQTAWKAAVVIAEHLGRAFIEQVLHSAGRSAPKRPYAYLYAAVERKLQRGDLEAKRLFAAVRVPGSLVDPDGAKLRIERPAQRPALALKHTASALPLELQRAAAAAANEGQPSARELYLAARPQNQKPD